MKEPTIGPNTGPPKRAPAKDGIAKPRSLAFQKSASAPPRIAVGDDPKTPCRNRNIIIDWIFVATATGIWKMAKRKNPAKSGIFRPYNSLSGPKSVGPTPNPRTKRDVARIMTSLDTLNSFAVTIDAALKTELAKVAHRLSVAEVMVMMNFFLRGLKVVNI